jgi:hypothetical protein
MAGYTNPFSFCQWEKITGSFTVNYGNLTQEEMRQLQGGLDIIYTSTVYVGILSFFTGFGGISGSVLQQGRRLRAEDLVDEEADQVRLQPGPLLERRLGHEPRSEVRYTLDYEILIPFPNDGFHFSAWEIYNNLKDLASNTSKSATRLVDIFEQEFSKLARKSVSKGCLLAVESAPEPTWIAWDAPLTEEISGECSGQCVNVHGWGGYDSQGTRIDCAFYEARGWCANGLPSNGQTVESLAIVTVGGVNVVEACCACGGGSTSAGKALRQLSEASSMVLGKENSTWAV